MYRSCNDPLKLERYIPVQDGPGATSEVYRHRCAVSSHAHTRTRILCLSLRKTQRLKKIFPHDGALAGQDNNKIIITHSCCL